MLDCLERKTSLSDIQGVIYTENNKTIINKERTQISDLDTVNFPYYDIMEFSEYLDNLHSSTSYIHNLKDYPRIYPLLCSRSCPFQCTFCYHDMQYRKRSLDNIFLELETAINKYKINSINIYDDCFAIDKRRLLEFCRRIKKLNENRSEDVIWTCQLTVNSAEENILKLLKESGCHAISYGFESYSREVLKSMRKPISPEQIRNAIKRTIDAKIAIQGGFIFGDVAETKESAKTTLNFWKTDAKGQLGLNFIQPYPGSKIFEHCLEKKIIKDKLEFIKKDMAPNISLWLNMTNEMTDKDIKKLKNDILSYQEKNNFYVVPISIKKVKEPNIFSINVKCPHCKQIIRYNNFSINFQYKYFYALGTQTVCRNCFMRFYIVSKIERFAYRHYSFVRKIRDILELVRYKFNKRNV